MSDKTDLASRATALKQKILKQHTSATSTGKKGNSRTNNNESVKSEAFSSDNREWGVYAVERDFSGVLASINISQDATLSTNNIAASVPEGPTTDNIYSGVTEKSGRKSRSRRVTTKNEELSTTIKTEDIAAILMSDSAPDKTESALPVLCLINIIPIEMSTQPNITTTTTSTHSVLDVLYNTLLREIPRSPHATNAATTDTLMPSYSSTTTKIEATFATTTPNDAAFALTIQEQNSEVKKRKLSSTTTTSNTTSKLSKSHTINGTSSNHNNTVAWSCTVCTFLNTTERFCSMCMTARVTTVPKLTNTSSNNGSSKPIRSATTNSLVSFIKTTTTSNKLTNNSVVDLVSSEDEGDGEVEIIDILIPTVSRPVGNLFKQETTVATVTNEASTINNNNEITLSTASAHSEVSTEVTVMQAHLNTIYTTMQYYLQSLALLRRTTFTTNTTYLSLYYELNLFEGSTEGEEEDDLLLLGLLLTNTTLTNTPVNNITIKEEAILTVDSSSNNSRPSLEDLIPAPPFFVVTGKRTGDPASRKGKSKFCGKSIISYQI